MTGLWGDIGISVFFEEKKVQTIVVVKMRMIICVFIYMTKKYDQI